MANRKDGTASVATYADHEVITPPHELRKAVTAAAPGDEDPVARAEAALTQLSSEFGGWMHAECERLETARQDVVGRGFTEKLTPSCSAPLTTSRARLRPSAMPRWPASPKVCAGSWNTRRKWHAFR